MIRVLGADTAIATVVAEARAAGERVAIVPAGGTREEVYAGFAVSLHFPDWFGHNLDALYDCLHTWAHEHPGTRLVWDGTAPFKAADPEYYARLLTVLADLVEERGTLEVTVVERV